MFNAIPSFDQIKETVADIGGKAKDMFKGIVDKIPSMDDLKTMIAGVGATAADFASRITDMLPTIDDLMAFLPSKEDILGLVDSITPSFLKDDTAAEKVLKLENQIADKIAKIEKHQAEIDEGDLRTAMGFSRKEEIKDLEKEIANLRGELNTANSQLVQNNVDNSSSVQNHTHGTKSIPISTAVHPLFAQTQN